MQTEGRQGPGLRVLVTGASGFIGRQVVHQLLSRGHEVWATSRSGQPPRQEEAATAHWSAWDVETSVQPAWPEVPLDGVIHLARDRDSRAFPEAGVSEARLAVVATQALLERVLSDGLTLVLAGTGDSVAGGPAIAREDDPVLAPRSYYGARKGAMEMLARPHWEAGLPVSVVRPVHPYGPGGDAFLVNRLVGRVAEDGVLEIDGHDGIVTNPVWVTDAAAGFVAALERRAAGLYQLGGPDTVTLRVLIKRIAALLGKSADIRDCDRRPPGGHAGTYDLATRDLGWSPTVSLDEGLLRLVAAASKA